MNTSWFFLPELTLDNDFYFCIHFIWPETSLNQSGWVLKVKQLPSPWIFFLEFQDQQVPMMLLKSLNVNRKLIWTFKEYQRKARAVEFSAKDNGSQGVSTLILKSVSSKASGEGRFIIETDAHWLMFSRPKHLTRETLLAALGAEISTVSVWKNPS